MSDNLEQRLRDAFEAHANQVGPHSLDYSRERDLRGQLAADEYQPQAPDRRVSSRWLALGGLAAAASVVGMLALTSINDSGSTLSPAAQGRSELPDADPTELPSSTSTEEDRLPGQVPGPSRGNQRPTLPPAPTALPSSSTPAVATPSSDASTGSGMSTSGSGSESASSTATDSATTSTTDGEEEPASSARASLSVSGAQEATYTAAISGVARTGGLGARVASWRIDFGDGTSREESVGECSTAAGSESFETTLGSGSHTYVSGQTYTMTLTAMYCGDTGPTAATSSQSVVVP